MPDLVAVLWSIAASHRRDRDGVCPTCGVLISDQPAHVIGMQVQYLRDHIHEHAHELGLTQEHDSGSLFDSTRTR